MSLKSYQEEMEKEGDKKITKKIEYNFPNFIKPLNQYIKEAERIPKGRTFKKPFETIL